MNFIDSICHRKPERSFHLKGHQFPVCARCTGIYISLFLYFIYSYYFYLNHGLGLVIFGIILLLPMYVDGMTQYYWDRESNNNLRLITGLIGGLGLAIIITNIIYFIFNILF